MMPDDDAVQLTLDEQLYAYTHEEGESDATDNSQETQSNSE